MEAAEGLKLEKCPFGICGRLQAEVQVGDTFYLTESREHLLVLRAEHPEEPEKWTIISIGRKVPGANKYAWAPEIDLGADPNALDGLRIQKPS